MKGNYQYKFLSINSSIMDQFTPLSELYVDIKNDPFILETLEPTIEKFGHEYSLVD